MNLDRLDVVLEGHPRYRIKQVREAVFARLVESWEEATSLPKGLRAELARECPLAISARVAESKEERTAKAAIACDDGCVVEAVLMRHRDGRNTVCVSSQAGCALGCDFCESGRKGLTRNLSAGEMVEQVLLFARRLKREGGRVTNVVVMGIGEPFLNYDNVLAAIRVINDPAALGIGARRISISTVGIPGGIERLAREPLQVNLAVSLHAATDELRNRLMPVNRKHPLRKVLDATARYLGRTNRRVMIEYLMLGGVNDSPEDAKRLAKLLKDSLGGLFVVNLISYNPTGRYAPSPRESVRRFMNELKKRGVTVVRRYRFGRDIKAACGQLAAERPPVRVRGGNRAGYG